MARTSLNLKDTTVLTALEALDRMEGLEDDEDIKQAYTNAYEDIKSEADRTAEEELASQ